MDVVLAISKASDFTSDKIYGEFSRVLKPGGSVIVRTSSEGENCGTATDPSEKSDVGWVFWSHIAVTHCKHGCGLIKLNGCTIELFQPEILRFKIFEPVLLLGKHRFAGVDMRIRVNGGGHTSQVYAIRQS
ncbi:unnamed protein product [Brassica oleracea]